MTDKQTVRVQQVEQTRIWFQDALDQLLQQMPYSQITVTALATRAGLSRRTFYRHYQTVDQVLSQLITFKVVQLFAAISDAQPRHFLELVYAYFEYWQRHVNFLRSLDDNQLFPQLLGALTAATPDSLLARMFPQSEPYIYAFAAGGIWNMLVSWLQAGAHDAPSEMAAKAHLVTKHLVAIM